MPKYAFSLGASREPTVLKKHKHRPSGNEYICIIWFCKYFFPPRYEKVHIADGCLEEGDAETKKDAAPVFLLPAGKHQDFWLFLQPQNFIFDLGPL